MGQQVDARSLRVSVISVAQANAKVQTMADPAVRQYLESDLESLLEHIKAESGVKSMSFSYVHAKMWTLLSHNATIPTVGQIDREVYAVALHEGFTVAERTRPEHAALRALGVSIHAL